MKKEGLELKRIAILLYIIIGLLTLNTVFVIINGSGTRSSSGSSGETLEETTDYDVSMFESIDEKGFMKTIKSSDTQVIFFGRSSCGYCVEFLPTLRQAQEDLGITTYYVDIEAVDTTSEDYKSMVSMIDAMTEAFNKEHGYTDDYAYEYLYGYTPLVVIAKDGKIVDIQVGYSDYDTYVALLKENGIK